ncbi:GNAT family N-acetyltransferase, partial [Streptomyces cinereoruber]|uniref:GNAT family N-acetyltransferase n=1 Tax=Streptomyces cinereoruber TaxID=67260 RepID=UPI00362DAB36
VLGHAAGDPEPALRDFTICSLMRNFFMLIETPRLRLRHFCSSDAAVFSAYRSDPSVARYQDWTAPVTIEAATAIVKEFASSDPTSPGWFQYAIELKSTGRLIGDVASRLHDNRMQADLGYTLAPEHQGHGYATEAAQALLDDLFTRGIRRVSAECDARNLRSAMLLQRLGFQLEGIRPQATWIKEEWTDDLLFGLLADRWKGING